MSILNNGFYLVGLFFTALVFIILFNIAKDAIYSRKAK